MTNPTSSHGGRGSAIAGPLPELALAGTLLLVGCAGGGQAPVRTMQVPSMSDALECAREEGRSMDFEVARAGQEERLLVLEREDEDVERSNPSFQRAVDQLRLQPEAGPEGSGRALEITARTYHEHRTRKGLTRRQRDASEGAVSAADALLERCGAG